MIGWPWEDNGEQKSSFYFKEKFYWGAVFGKNSVCTNACIGFRFFGVSIILRSPRSGAPRARPEGLNPQLRAGGMILKFPFGFEKENLGFAKPFHRILWYARSGTPADMA
ncbi:MAG: hypothetical protein KAX39_02340 [candidate division Zixibacteria bacterium]|nr:hypothetical protein [candidate division Zixibacteria bacterium]